MLYPLEELMAERDELVYPKTGSHWSEYGAFVGYRALMAEITEIAAGAPAHAPRDPPLVRAEAPATSACKFEPPVGPATCTST